MGRAHHSHLPSYTVSCGIPSRFCLGSRASIRHVSSLFARIRAAPGTRPPPATCSQAVPGPPPTQAPRPLATFRCHARRRWRACGRPLRGAPPWPPPLSVTWPPPCRSRAPLPCRSRGHLPVGHVATSLPATWPPPLSVTWPPPCRSRGRLPCRSRGHSLSVTWPPPGRSRAPLPCRPRGRLPVGHVATSRSVTWPPPSRSRGRLPVGDR